MSICSWCKEYAGLHCSKCKMVCYCSKEHQIAHFDVHKAHCQALKDANKRTKSEEKKLRKLPGGDPFDYAVGHFWQLTETRNYMRSRVGLIRILEKIGTHSSLTEAVNVILDCITLCPGDNMGVRDLAPSMLLQLGRDQDCYDYLKW